MNDKLMDATKDKKILIIDDKPVNIKMLVKTLERHQFSNIHSVSDSREAMLMFERVQPDVVLLDLNMPFINGMEILREIRASHPKHPAILVLTADMNIQQTKKAVADAGADDVFFKPLVLADVVNAVERCLT